MEIVTQNMKEFKSTKNNHGKVKFNFWREIVWNIPSRSQLL